MILPDLLAAGLRLVFVGTAAGTQSARVGAYYANPTNKFWPTLHHIGLTPKELKPNEFRELPKLGIGLTDLCKTEFGMDHEITREAFDVADLRARLREAKPVAIAFNGKKGAAHFLARRQRDIACGRQPQITADPITSVLPSTSGAASGYWSLQPWQDLSDWFHQRS